jgi:hypothetical protein
MFTILKLILVIVVLILSALLVRTSQLLWTNDQTHFTNGTVMDLPNGFYAGSVAGPPVSWKGKKFDVSHSTGINVLTGPNGNVEKYPFITSVGPGVHDNKQVIRIDYDVPQNPLWLRPILDELVEVTPGEYLGKMQLRIIPAFPFTLTYFTLKASS